MQEAFSAAHLRPIPTLSPITAQAVEPNRRLRQLINMSRALSAQEWAELREIEEKAGEIEG